MMTDSAIESPPDSEAKRSGRAKLVALVLAVIALFAAFRFLPIDQYLGSFLEYVKSLGVWGPVILVVAYVLATIFMAPGVILTLGAGFAFGLFVGTLVVSVGSILGATAAFLIGRNFARDFVESQARRFPKFAAVDHAVQESGFKIVLLTRLSPLFPFNAINYLYGATNVSLKNYFFASWIGMLPGTIMYVYLGTAAKSLAQIVSRDAQGGLGPKILFGVGLLVTIVVTIYVTRIASRAMKEYVPIDEGSRP